ncbi:helix-turn-helix domain-containing protein, partial [Pseudogulbenkiania subflava]
MLLFAYLPDAGSTMRKLTLTLNEAEVCTLEQLAKAHPKEYFRLRGKALIAVNQGQDIATVAAVLRISGESIRTWIHNWERHGLVGILNARAGGRPAKLTED